MKTRTTPDSKVEFWQPQGSGWPVIVSRKLTDKSTEVIGQVYADIDPEEGVATYVSLDKNGEELLPPTIEYGEIESHFEAYARQLEKEQKRAQEEKELNDVETGEREAGIAKIRNLQERLARKRYLSF